MYAERLHCYYPQAVTKGDSLMQKTLSDEKLFICASPAEVWRFITAPDCILKWSKDLTAIALSPPYDQDRSDAEISGTMRTICYEDGLQESQLVTDWVSHQILGYSTVGTTEEKYADIRHIGMFNLFAEGEGTELQWLNYFEFSDTESHTGIVQKRLRSYR